MKKIKLLCTLIIILIIISVSLKKIELIKSYNQRGTTDNLEIAEIQIIDKNNRMQELYANPKAEKYVVVDIIIDGNYYNNVGIRTKGSSVYTYIKQTGIDNYSFKVKLDYNNKEQKYKGMTEIFLNAEIFDPTGIKEYLVYKTYNKMGIDTQSYYLGHLRIGKQDRGLVTMVEVINTNYIKHRYNSEEANVYKIEMADEAKNIAGGADFRYCGENIEAYGGLFNKTKTTNTDKDDMKRLISKIKTISETSEPEIIEKCFVDFDKIIKMIAINKVVANIDSFISKPLRNYYLYEENGKIDIIPFDFDLSFNTNINPLYWKEDIYNYNLETSNEEFFSRITEIIVENEVYLEKYNRYLEETVQTIENMEEEGLIVEIDKQINNIIEQNENKIYSYSEYKKGITNLKEFIKNRRVFL